MTIDVERARQETPGVAHVLHFNNAGAALMPQPVVDATVAHLRMESLLGGYESAERAWELTERVYSAAASLINCVLDEIAFVENATAFCCE